MFADKQTPPLPDTALPNQAAPGRSLLDKGRLGRFLNKVGEIARWLATPPPLPPRDGAEQDWYAGIGAMSDIPERELHASGFSDQLFRLQKALSPVKTQAVEPETAQALNRRKT